VSSEGGRRPTAPRVHRLGGIFNITEAQQHTWLGEVDGLRRTLTALRDKKQHVKRLVAIGISDLPEQLD
jgi:hypothetical protein